MNDKILGEWQIEHMKILSEIEKGIKKNWEQFSNEGRKEIFFMLKKVLWEVE